LGAYDRDIRHGLLVNSLFAAASSALVPRTESFERKENRAKSRCWSESRSRKSVDFCVISLQPAARKKPRRQGQGSSKRFHTATQRAGKAVLRLEGAQTNLSFIKQSLNRFVVKCRRGALPCAACVSNVSGAERFVALRRESPPSHLVARRKVSSRCGAGATGGENLTTRRQIFVVCD